MWRCYLHLRWFMFCRNIRKYWEKVDHLFNKEYKQKYQLTNSRTPQVPSKYLRKYVIKKPNQMAVYVDLLAYLSIVITSQTKYLSLATRVQSK